MTEAQYQKHEPKPLFYLVLKGEIVIFADHDNSCLRLMAPELPEHAYVAGPWLAGTQIPKHRRLHLDGVAAGTDLPANHSEMLIRLPNPVPRPDLARFEVVAPLPKDILPGAKQEAEHMKITIIHDDGTTTPIPKMPKHTCLAAILVYEWDGQQEPSLHDPESGRRWLSGGKLPLYRSLHLCAAGETKDSEMDPDHAHLAFQRAAAVLGINAVIDFQGGGNITPTNTPPGLSHFETNLSYFETLELEQALGEILEGGAGKIPVVGPLHFLGGNCGPIGT